MSRKSFGAQPLSYPQAVYIVATYDENGKPDAMNAAWGGISDTNELTLCLSAGHKTVKNLQKTGAFTVSMGDAPHVVACDYVGLESGNKVDNKLEKAGFTVTPSVLVNAPVINELAICLECRVKSYSPETGLLCGEIVNVSVDEAAMTDGKVDVEKVAPIVFDPFNHTYHILGHKVGDAFHDGAALK
ncbi:MAG: flavin reductase [Oscillospiraceae bacterium]|nr:flavin reductase [Oscillospiraceae bacterium]